MAALQRSDAPPRPSIGIRWLLIGLFVALGAALCLAVASQFSGALREYREATAVSRSNLVRERMAHASLAVGDERLSGYLALLSPPNIRRRIADDRAETDAAMAATAKALSSLGDEEGAATVSELEGRLASLRQAVDLRLRSPDPGEREAGDMEIFDGYSAVADILLDLRVALLSREQQTDSATAASFRLRVYDSLLLDNIAINRALLAGLALHDHPGHRGSILQRAERGLERAQMAVELLESQAPSTDARIHRTVRTLSSLSRTVYRPLAEQLLVRFAQAEGAVPLDVRWEEHSARMAAVAGGLQEQLTSFGRLRLEDRRVQSLRLMWLWGVVLVLGVGGVVLGTMVVLRRVIRPLDDLRGAMLAVAGGQLDAPLPAPHWNDEIAQMADTLRVFKANALRRARLQEERLALHERLEVTYRQLRRDVEAAGAVQAALLPTSARLGGVRFQGRLRPSHLISGDSYDVVRQPNGAVHFFLVDVAGHGAASALVSIASHYTLAQAIQQRRADQGLAELVATLNRDWPEHLPYFTLIVGELRPETDEGTLVQAGHPSPALLHRGDGVETLGQGGLPIGVLRDAEFEEIRFPFRPGDRLLIYSDGLSEAENGQGQPFGEGRLVELLRAHAGAESGRLLDLIDAEAQAWRGADALDDDMTLLILEAIPDEHH